jgi:ribosome recycling factor
MEQLIDKLKKELDIDLENAEKDCNSFHIDLSSAAHIISQQHIFDMSEKKQKSSKIEFLATILIEKPNKIIITPNDKKDVKRIQKTIESGIFRSDLGYLITNHQQQITVTIPILTKEVRDNFVKELKKHFENRKIKLRAKRNDIKKIINKFSKEDKKKLEEEIEKQFKMHNQVLDKLLELKTKNLINF